jgi:transcriptional regulator with GAF, ATPase, and Fis domain
VDINNAKFSEDDRLKIVSEFAQFLEHGNNGMQEVLQHLNRKSFATFECQSVHLTRSNSDNQLVMEVLTGVEIPNRFRNSEYMTLDSKVPIADVFRSGKIVWINTLPDWGPDYPLLKNYEAFFRGETFIAIPIFHGNVVKGVLSLVCQPKLNESDSLDDFFMAIAGLLCLQSMT